LQSASYGAPIHMIRIVPMPAAASFEDAAQTRVPAVGMTMGVRIGALLLVCYLSLLLSLDGDLARAAAKHGVLASTAWVFSGEFSCPGRRRCLSGHVFFLRGRITTPIENPLRPLAFFSHHPSRLHFV